MNDKKISTGKALADNINHIHTRLIETSLLKEEIANNNKILCQIDKAVTLISNALLLNNGTVYFMGNGGSASDSLHLAAEFTGRFELNRMPMKAIALPANVAELTAIGNDFGYHNLFRRQVEAFCTQYDCLVAISTSGKSENVLHGIWAAKDSKTPVVGLTGKDGGAMKELCDVCICVPSVNVARIQEAHITIGHIIAELVEQSLPIT